MAGLGCNPWMGDFLHLLCVTYFSGGIFFFLLYFIVPQSFETRGLVVHGKTFTGKPDWTRVPKRLFSLFYIAGIIFCSLGIITVTGKSLPKWMLLLHLFRRLIESTLMPYSKDSKMHIIHSIVGLSYYLILSLCFNLSEWGEFADLKRSSLLVAIFVLLNLLQLLVHLGLHRARSMGQYQAIGDQSKIFEYVLCPHYLMEIGIHSVFLVLSNFIHLLLLNLLFVALNLTISARQTLQWYKMQFPKRKKYPKAIIPFLL